MAFSLNALSWINAPVIVAACSMIGASLALMYRSVAAAPIAAGTIYLVALSSFRAPPVRILWEGGATGDLSGLMPNPEVLGLTWLANVMIAAGLALLMLCTGRSSRHLQRWLLVAALAILALAVSVVAPGNVSYYTSAFG